METKMIYYAKDGMRFDDPIKCAEYERKLGTLPGTVGALKKTLEPYKDYYAIGLLVVWHKEHAYYHSFMTYNISNELEKYTDIEELSEEDLYAKCKVSTIIQLIDKNYDDDDLCEYTFFYSQSLHFNILGYMKNDNGNLWEKLESKKSEQSV